jgi:hypothetical protein
MTLEILQRILDAPAHDYDPSVTIDIRPGKCSFSILTNTAEGYEEFTDLDTMMGRIQRYLEYHLGEEFDGQKPQ